MKMTREQNVFLAKRNIVDTIWKEAHIEGVTATFPETKEVFEGRTVASLSVDETVVINNLKHAWEFILSTLDVPMDIRYIKQINKEVGAGLVFRAGDLRQGIVNIGGTAWMPEIPDYDDFKEKIERVNLLSDEEQAVSMFSLICRTQPFNDGNKRTAQIAANKILIENGDGILAIPVAEKKNFESCLIDFYETGDPADLHKFLLEKCILKMEFEASHEEEEFSKM